MVKKEDGICTIQVKANCGHVFDVYIDKKFKVRGFHRPDFVIISELEDFDKKLSKLLHKQEENLLHDSKQQGDIKNYFDGDGYLEDFSVYYDHENDIDIYSRSRLLGILQVPELEADKPKIILASAEKSSIATGDLDLEEIKRQYDLRMQKIKTLMKTSSGINDNDAGLLKEIKQNLDQYYRETFGNFS